jgi:hypothetical protein
VHTLIESGFVDVVGNHNGGAPKTTRHYRINLERLTACADANPTPCAGASQSVIKQLLNSDAPVLTLTGKPTTKRKSNVRREWPDDFEVTEKMLAYAVGLGMPSDDVMPESDKCRDWHLQNAVKRADHYAA